MFPLERRLLTAFGLAVLLLGLPPLRGYGDEMKYVPDGAQIILAMDYAAIIKTKAYDELVKLLPKNDLLPTLNNVARITVANRVAAKEPGVEVVVFTMPKAITVAEAKALKKPAPFQKNFGFKEIKHGSVVIYQETYQFQDFGDDKLSKVYEGQAFFLDEGKYIVQARTPEILKKILDRNKAPVLSKPLQAGLKEVGPGNTFAVVMDFESMPAANKDFLADGVAKLTGQDVMANVGKVQTFTFTINEDARVRLKAKLICSDAGAAGTIKVIAQKVLEEGRKLAKTPKKGADPKLKKFDDSLVKLLDAATISSAGNQMILSAEVEPEAVAYAFGTFFILQGATRADPGPAQQQTPIAPEEPKKSKTP